MKKTLSFVMLVLGFAMLALAPDVARAQEGGEPALPPPLEALAQEGAQIRYLGRHAGMDGWITMRSGQEQYFYATPDGRALLMGVLFDNDGKLITMRQVKALQEKSGDVLGSFAVDDIDSAIKGVERAEEFKTPSAQLYDDVGNSNWVALGSPEAPYIYMFVDPQCPHCHAFTQDLRTGYIETGQLQVRLIPVGLREDTKAQAAFLLAAPNPEKRWFRHLDGDKKALPVSAGVNEQGVERNLAIMQSWQFDVTPLTIYKNAGGEIKIVQGRASNPAVIMRDLLATTKAE